MRRLLFVLALAACAGCAPHAAPPPHRDGVFRVAVVGDSVAHGAGDESGRGIAGNLDALLPRPHLVQNLGINGARTWNVRRLLRDDAVRATVAACDAVVLSIGGNDLYGDPAARLATLLAPSHAINRAAMRIAAIVATIHRLNPSTRVYLLGLYDPYKTRFLDEQVAHWDATLIERFARDRAVDVVRITDVVSVSAIDHFHPGAAGYAAIAQRLAPAIVHATFPTAPCLHSEAGGNMARRWGGHMNGEQFLGNTAKYQVHDLENEKTGPNQCQIDEIIRAGHDRPFTTLASAHASGYSDCDHCLP